MAILIIHAADLCSLDGDCKTNHATWFTLVSFIILLPKRTSKNADQVTLIPFIPSNKSLGKYMFYLVVQFYQLVKLYTLANRKWPQPNEDFGHTKPIHFL